MEESAGLVVLRSEDEVTFVGCGKGRHESWDVDLPTALPVRIKVEGGATDVKADLVGVRLVGLEFAGGATDLHLKLPFVQGDLPVKVAGGAVNVTIEVPPDAGVRIDSQTVLGSVRTPGIDLVETGGARQTAGFESAAERISIKVDGGATDIEVRRR